MTDEQIRRLRELAEGMSAIPALLDEVERLRKVKAARELLSAWNTYAASADAGVTDHDKVGNLLDDLDGAASSTRRLTGRRGRRSR